MAQSLINALVVTNAIQTLKAIDIDGETMQFIIEEIGMDDQMKKQLHTQDTSTEETQHRMTMILDDLARLREWAVKQNASDDVLVMFNNIEIACDLDENECLIWSKYSD